MARKNFCNYVGFFFLFVETFPSDFSLCSLFLLRNIDVSITYKAEHFEV